MGKILIGVFIVIWFIVETENAIINMQLFDAINSLNEALRK
jgi:hypothetical protein